MLKSKMEEIKELDARIESLEGMRRVLLDEWANQACPYSIGDIVSVQGYSHKGKQCRIISIGWTYSYRDRYEWTVKAKLILKDGTDGKVSVKWNEGNE